MGHPSSNELGSTTLELQEARIGIVLAGGGGKGAYQIGCWKKLRELGLDNFSVISGTSVGALNAALIAQGDLHCATDIWINLAQDKVLRTIFLSKWAIGTLYLACTLAWTAIKLAAFLQPAFGLPLILWLVWYTRLRDTGTPVSAFDLLLSSTYLRQIPVWIWVMLICWIGGVLWLLLTADPGGDFWGKESWRASSRAVSQLLGRLISVGSNRPLSELIAANINLARIRRTGASVYATVSVFASFESPYKPNYLHASRNPDTGKTPAPRLLSKPCGPIKMWVPEFVELTCLPDDVALRNVLLQSANLPLVFPEGRLGAHRSVDGGIAMFQGVTQNVPLLPAVEKGCDFIIVVFLDPDADSSLRSIQEMVTTGFQIRHLRGLRRETADAVYGKCIEHGFHGVPLPTFSISEQQLICVVPSRSLGSTVDFSGGSRVQALITRGEEDMEAALRTRPIFDQYIRHRCLNVS